MPVVKDGPPLDLQAEVVFPDNTTARWDRDSNAPSQPQHHTFNTRRYTGFTDGQVMLARDIGLDYPDLGLLRGLNLIGHDGSVAYEGMIGSQPRTLDAGPSIGIQANGWMAHAKDETFSEVFVDRDLSRWVAPSRTRTATLYTESFGVNGPAQLLDEQGNPVVELAFTGKWEGGIKPISEAWWLPQPGISIGALYYDLIGGNAVNAEDANWKVFAALSSDDHFGGVSPDASARLLPAPVAGYLLPTVARAAAALQLWYLASPQGTSGATYAAHFAKLAVYGTHGLTRRGEDPGGLFVNDMIGWIANNFAPLLDTSGIQATTFPVPHASFIDETYPYDAWQTLNAYHRWEIDVYEGRRLNYYPIDLTDYDWIVRKDDPGTTINLQGVDSTNLCNGVIVRYRDLDTGYERRLTPSSHEQLRDNNPNNPANEAGRSIYPTLPLSVPTTEEGALQMGRMFLAEFNQAQAPGSIKVTGHVRDRAGHWQPAWKMRSSDRLIIEDMPSEGIRVVGETGWDHSSLQQTIAVDSSLKRLDAILARLANGVEASGFSLP